MLASLLKLFVCINPLLTLKVLVLKSSFIHYLFILFIYFAKLWLVGKISTLCKAV